MKKLISIVILLALSICAFAATSNTGNMSLMSAGKLNGTQLAAGDYKLTWDGQGDKVQVNIIGKGVKISAPATIVTSQARLQDSVIKGEDGTIQEIHLSGKKLIVKFN